MKKGVRPRKRGKLYHGSHRSLSVILPRKGHRHKAYVYATGHPIYAARYTFKRWGSGRREVLEPIRKNGKVILRLSVPKEKLSWLRKPAFIHEISAMGFRPHMRYVTDRRANEYIRKRRVKVTRIHRYATALEALKHHGVLIRVMK